MAQNDQFGCFIQSHYECLQKYEMMYNVDF